jgi:DGQHR domain-containing protein
MVAKNLNLMSLRGSASLGLLAQISQPDQYDQLSNDAGVQRSPAEKHAKEALAYAFGSLNASPVDDPRAFTEVILNIRDLAPLKLVDYSTKSEVNKESWSDFKGNLLEVFLNLDLVVDSPFAMTGAIQISRVDGNHRLLHASKIIHSGEMSIDDFPVVPFSMFVGLSPDQERKIFVDINGNHKNMSRSLVLNFQSKSLSQSQASSTKELAAWLANQISSSGQVFDQMVNLGGDLRGYRLQYNTSPPLTLVGLTNAMLEYLSGGAYLRKINENDPQFLTEAIDAFFKALRKEFPQGFEQYKDYVVIKALGLSVFSRLAGTIFSNQHFTRANFDMTIAKACLRVVFEELDLSRFKWQGYTSKSGMTVMFQRVQQILTHAGYGEFVQTKPGW